MNIGTRVDDSGNWLPLLSLLVIAPILLWTSDPPQAPAPVAAASMPQNDFVVRNARVFDGMKILPKADVWVHDGLIKAIAPQIKAPAGTRSIDAAGDTLIPGLIDAHTHAYGPVLSQALIFGVTTELDMFTS